MSEWVCLCKEESGQKTAITMTPGILSWGWSRQSPCFRVGIEVSPICCSVTHLCLTLTPWTAAHQASLFFAVSQNLLKLVHWVSNAIQPSHPLLSPLAFNLCQHQGLFQRVGSSPKYWRWPKYWSFSFSISPSNEYSSLISMRIDWFDLLGVQGNFKSFPEPQYKSSLALSLFYGLTLTSIHDYWKNHSFGYTDLFQRSDVSAF